MVEADHQQERPGDATGGDRDDEPTNVTARNRGFARSRGTSNTDAREPDARAKIEQSGERPWPNIGEQKLGKRRRQSEKRSRRHGEGDGGTVHIDSAAVTRPGRDQRISKAAISPRAKSAAAAAAKRTARSTGGMGLSLAGGGNTTREGILPPPPTAGGR